MVKDEVFPQTKNQLEGVFVKHYAPVATKSKKLFLASRSQGH